MKMIKTTFAKQNIWKTIKKPKSVSKQKVVLFFFELAPLTPDVTGSKLQRYGENTGDKKLPVEHTQKVWDSHFRCIKLQINVSMFEEE